MGRLFPRVPTTPLMLRDKYSQHKNVPNTETAKTAFTHQTGTRQLEKNEEIVTSGSGANSCKKETANQNRQIVLIDGFQMCLREI